MPTLDEITPDMALPHNIFADMGLPEPEERQAKALISILIEQKIKGLGVDQVERLTGLSETELSLIVRGVCGSFSLERMTEALEVLDNLRGRRERGGRPA